MVFVTRQPSVRSTPSFTDPRKDDTSPAEEESSRKIGGRLTFPNAGTLAKRLTDRRPFVTKDIFTISTDLLTCLGRSHFLATQLQTPIFAPSGFCFLFLEMLSISGS